MAQSKNGSSDILIVAGEASSALYAQRLMEHWLKIGQPVKAFGVGSQAMEKLGFERLGRSEDMAVVGLTEVLKHYSEIKKVFLEILKQVQLRKPKVILLLDYPDFNLRLAKELKPLGIPIVYYISPQIWAWRKSRIHDIRKLVDKMLVVLPFEKDFYKNYGVDVEFVGHPLLDEVKSDYFSEPQRDEARSRYGILSNEICIGLMPGSRKSEIRHHLITQVQAAEILHKQNNKIKFALLVAPTLSKEAIQGLLPRYDIPLTIIQDDPLKMVSLVDIVLCASGTATLVVGLLKKPMVIMYKMNALSAFLARIVVKGTQHFGLINLVLGKRVVPELFQNEASPERLSAELLRYIESEKYKKAVVEDLSSVQPILGSKGATVRVAEILRPFLF